MANVKELVKKHLDEINADREWLHQHPELSHEEKETSAYIAKKLREIGIEPKENVGPYGITAVINGKNPGKCVALRADFDALPVKESTGLPFSSVNEGVAHSCGHDVHTATLLGAARVLLEMKDEFDGCVKLIFQPSEEDAGDPGSPKMIAAGCLENPKVDAIFGQHCWPLLPVGKIGIRNGGMMASSDRFYITVHGKNSHGSAPESGIDAIVIAAQIITTLQTIVSRNVGPLDSCVITIGVIKGGSKYNVISDEVYMEGTCRNLNPDVRNSIPGRMEKIIKGVAEGMGGTADFKYDFCYSPTVNDPEMFEKACATIKRTVGEENLVIPERSALGGEDFSFYTEKVPAAFAWLGVHGEGKPYYPIHHGSFAAEKEALPIGTEFLVNTAIDFLAGK